MIIETERLSIRHFTESDAMDLYEYLSVPEIYRFEPGNPISQQEAIDIAVERSKGNDFLAVALRDRNKMIGHLYFKQIEPLKFLTWELGYIFNPKFHARGYASEASKTIVDFAFEEYGAHRIIANCNIDNIASWKLLEKIGFSREGHFRKKGLHKN